MADVKNVVENRDFAKVRSHLHSKTRPTPVDASQERRVRVNVLGVLVDATNLFESTARIMRWISEKERTYVCVTGVHGIMESQRQPDLKLVHNAAGMVTPDGMPLVYVSRWATYSKCERVYGPDLMLEVCRESVRHGYKHFFFGTTPATLSRLTNRLSEQFPGLQVAGTFAPPFRPLTESERTDVVARMNECAPDIVWVGLSTPKQERWMADHRQQLAAPVLIGVGAAFDFHSGTVRQAPRWIQPLCLEWIFRLLCEPKRLWKRYLLNNPQFIVFLIMQRLGFKNY
jgi:N-acetylglucosaminyldiphosphoundecaprenol N-acetyl-beta-D-mannosaminyltransferase